MQVDDKLFLLWREGTTLEIGPEIVDPSKTAALAAPLQAGISRDVAPRSLSVAQHVSHQPLILLRRPQPLSQFHYIPRHQR